MNLAVGCVENGQARRLYVQQVESAVEDELDYFIKVRAGVDVVGDVEQRLCNARLFFLFAVDVRVAVADGVLLREVADEVDLVVVPLVSGAAMVQADQPEQLQVEGDGDEQDGFAAEAFDQLLQDRGALLHVAVGSGERV